MPSSFACMRRIPARQDLPQAGPLLLYREPSMPGIRIDAGVTEGSEVGVHYDPLLAKLIATARRVRRRVPVRWRALRQLPDTWDPHEHPAPRRTARAPAIHQPATWTRAFSTWRAMPSGLVCLRAPPPEALAVAAAARRRARLPVTRRGSFETRLDPWSSLGVRVSSSPTIPSRSLPLGNGRYQSHPWDNATGCVCRRRRATPGCSSTDASTSSATHADGSPRRTRMDEQDALTAPMPATVLAIHVAPGQEVERNEVVMVLEAMKMELPIRSPRDGVVKAIGCQVGELVQPGATLLELDDSRATRSPSRRAREDYA